MSEQEYNSLRPGMYVRIRYGSGRLSKTLRKLRGKSKNGMIIWFTKVRKSWTSSPYAFYSKWNALRWLEVA